MIIYEKDGRKCLIRTPTSWKGFFKRLFGRHEEVKKDTK